MAEPADVPDDVSDDVDAYLVRVDEPARTALAHLRTAILSVVPDAEPVISYGAPAFRVDGKVVAGFSASRNHLSYLPHSGSVVASLGGALDGYATSKGAVRFTADAPLPPALVTELVVARLRELGLEHRATGGPGRAPGAAGRAQ